MDLVEEVSKRVVQRLKKEGAKKDKEFREKAERVYNNLLKALENRKEEVLRPVKSGLFADEKDGMFYLDGEDIGFDDFGFYFGEAGKRNPAYFDSDEMFEHAIFIPGLKESGNISNLANRVDYYYKEAVIHELIHALIMRECQKAYRHLMLVRHPLIQKNILILLMNLTLITRKLYIGLKTFWRKRMKMRD